VPKVFGFVVVCLLGLTVYADEPNPRTHVYFSEYRKPVRGSEGVYTLDMVFFVRLAPQKAEAMLRGEIDRILQMFPPEGNILANAWYSRTGDKIDEELIGMTDGSQSLVYWSKLRKTITFDQYERQKKKR